MLVQVFLPCQELNYWRNIESSETWPKFNHTEKRHKILYELFLFSYKDIYLFQKLFRGFLK